MKTVWKYKVSLEPIQTIEMQKDAQILRFHQQGSRQEDDISIWCLVETENPTEVRTFMMFITGDEIPHNVEYIDTVWIMNGVYVLHFFEVKKGL